MPHTEIDALFHGPDWTPRESFVDDVDALIAQRRWVTEWQYPSVRERLAEHADLMVWLDLPRHRVMRQVVARTIHRRLKRVELWNGNREGSLLAVLTDPEHIIRWAWTSHHRNRDHVHSAAVSNPHLTIVQCLSHRESQMLLAALAGREPSPEYR